MTFLNKTLNFPNRLTNCSITLSKEKYAYTGKACKPTITVSVKASTLKQNRDYVVSYKNNKNIGQATVIVKEINRYEGTVKKTFTIYVKKGKTTVKTIKIGKNVKTVGISAFEGCTKLSSVMIGSNVTKIGDKAFKSCTSLKSITIPSKVTTIGKETFHSCSKLGSITIRTTKLKSVGSNAFKGIKSTAKIKVPAKKLTAYKNLLKGKGQGKKVKIIKGVVLM